MTKVAISALASDHRSIQRRVCGGDVLELLRAEHEPVIGSPLMGSIVLPARRIRARSLRCASLTDSYRIPSARSAANVQKATRRRA
jgi:hypothetical protein